MIMLTRARSDPGSERTEWSYQPARRFCVSSTDKHRRQGLRVRLHGAGPNRRGIRPVPRSLPWGDRGCRRQIAGGDRLLRWHAALSGSGRRSGILGGPIERIRERRSGGRWPTGPDPCWNDSSCRRCPRAFALSISFDVSASWRNRSDGWGRKRLSAKRLGNPAPTPGYCFCQWPAPGRRLPIGRR